MSDVPSDPSAGTPAPEQPMAPAPPADASGGSKRTVLLLAGALAVVVVILIAVVAVSMGGEDDDAGSGEEGAAQEVFLEPVDHVQDPFTPPVGKGVATVASTTSTSTTAAETTTTLETRTAVSSELGGQPGLYGGTRDQKTCDKEKLVSYLEDNPEKGKAWADTLGIDQDDIRTYVDGLTPVLLRTDTRVTNHGYRNGKATSIQAVLQAGTAVLVDDYGRPVTKCACGNPLTSPVASAATYTGTRWEGFDPQQITVVIENTVIINTFVLIDNETGDEFTRPAGTGGTDDGGIDDLPPDDLPPDEEFEPCDIDPDSPACVDLEPEDTAVPEPPDASNDALSGPYTLDLASTGDACAGNDTSADVAVTVAGTSPDRTVSFEGVAGEALAGPLTDDLTFEVQLDVAGGGEFDILGDVSTTMSGEFELKDNGAVTLAGSLTLTIEEGDTCTFDLTGYLA